MSATKNVRLQARRRRRAGQGMTEYVVLVGLIAILLIGAVTTFKDSLGNAFNAASGKIKSDITDQIKPADAKGN